MKPFAITVLFVATLFVAACTDSSVKESGELVWPEITQQTKPWSRWWWPASAVQESDISARLDDYQDAGLGGLEITTIYGARGWEDKYREYLTPEWMDLFSYTLDEARKRDIGIDLANASGWPFGGPWVTPDYSCRYLAPKVFRVKGGEILDEKIEYIEKAMVRSLGLKTTVDKMDYPVAANDSLQQYAFEQVRYPLSLPLIAVTANSNDGRFIDLTDKVDKDGKLFWTAPEGDWTVCALFLGWHGKQVERAGPGGEGDVIDHFSGKAIRRYLAKFDEAFKGYDISYLRYYFNDSYEVDDAMGNSDWTEDFFDEFKARRGYDLKEHIPQLLGFTDDKDSENRIVFDYRTTIGELLLEKYSTLWQVWAARQGKGIRNQAHGSPANILDLYAVSDVPETEGRSIIGMKTASSAAHVTDKTLTSSESCTWLNDHFKSTLGDVKTSVDTYLLAGVNHIFYHGTCLSPDDAPWPGWLFYAAVHFQPTNSFWTDFAAFNKYVARCQSFLQAGLPDNDMLLFFDATDLLSERGREQLLYHMSQTTAEQSAIGKSARELYNRGYTWDYVTDKMLAENIAVKNGKFVTRAGSQYKTLVIPECTLMIPETFSRIVGFAKKGATVLVIGSLPEDIPGFGNLEEERKSFESLKSSLKFEQADKMSIAACGKGRIIVSSDLDAMISEAGVSRETLYDLGLQSISRVKPDGGKYYFIKNPLASAVEGWIPLDVVSGTVGIYNPMTGKSGYARTRAAEDGRKTEVYLTLIPDESLILETFSGIYEGIGYHFYEPAGEAVTLPGPWKVRFTKGGPELPESLVISGPGSWTEYGQKYEIFSGSAEYVTVLDSISVPAVVSADASHVDSAFRIDLGDVRNSAAVYVDDVYVGTVFKKPYAVVVDADRLVPGSKLKVVVSNSMENRIAWMDRNAMPWRIFYNANIAARTSFSRGSDGYFSAESWSVQPSGLLGPVTITPVK